MITSADKDSGALVTSRVTSVAVSGDSEAVIISSVVSWLIPTPLLPVTKISVEGANSPVVGPYVASRVGGAADVSLGGVISVKPVLGAVESGTTQVAGTVVTGLASLDDDSTPGLVSVLLVSWGPVKC